MSIEAANRNGDNPFEAEVPPIIKSPDTMRDETELRYIGNRNNSVSSRDNSIANASTGVKNLYCASTRFVIPVKNKNRKIERWRTCPAKKK